MCEDLYLRTGHHHRSSGPSNPLESVKGAPIPEENNSRPRAYSKSFWTDGRNFSFGAATHSVFVGQNPGSRFCLVLAWITSNGTTACRNVA